MYDLTARQSFVAVRPWLSSVEVSWGPPGGPSSWARCPLWTPDSHPTFSGKKPVQASMRQSTQVPSTRLVTGDPKVNTRGAVPALMGGGTTVY